MKTEGTQGNAMQAEATRETDQHNGRMHPVVRAIGLPWILSTLGLGALTAIGMFYSLRDVAKEQAAAVARVESIAADVKAIDKQLQRQELARVGEMSEMKFKLDDVARRLTVVESKK